MEKVPRALRASSVGIISLLSCPSPGWNRRGHFLESYCGELQGFAAVKESAFTVIKLKVTFSKVHLAGFG